MWKKVSATFVEEVTLDKQPNRKKMRAKF